MRRFFRSHRDEDFNQNQYLTAQCNRLTQEKAVLERECLLSRERERILRNELEILSNQLCQQEQVTMEIRIEHDQLIGKVCHYQDRVEFLQQRMGLVVEESTRETAQMGLHMEQVNTELLHLQSSEVQLEGLMEELHTEALYRAALIEDLQAQLHSQINELKELQCSHSAATQRMVQELQSATERQVQELQQENQRTVEELKQENQRTVQVLQSTTERQVQELQQEKERTVQELQQENQRTVQELQQENQSSLTKLQETAEQFEWLCEQQRFWMCCVKRFKDCLSEEKEVLVLQVSRLEKEVADLRKRPQSDTTATDSLCCPLEEPDSHCSRVPSLWDRDVLADLQMQVDKWKGMYEDLFNRFTPRKVTVRTAPPSSQTSP